LLDQPHIVAAAQPFLQSLGVAERVQCVGGDILAGIPVTADLYLLKSVLQHWDDEAAGAILAHCRAAMPETARLLIIERLLPESAADDAGAIMLDLHMMAITGGRVRSLAEIETLLAQAGFTLAKVTPASPGLSVLTAVAKSPHAAR
ncbi:MAG: methyltransferase, partial [Methyloceanibacter sp.]